jgi:hypothetical protein
VIQLIACLTATLLFSSCALFHHQGKAPQRLPTPPPHNVWTYPGGQAGPMKIILNADGTVTFEGGFKNLGPAVWVFDEPTRELSLVIPGLTDADATAAQCGDKNTAYDSKTHAIHYALAQNDQSICFLGWVFYSTAPAKP